MSCRKEKIFQKKEYKVLLGIEPRRQEFESIRILHPNQLDNKTIGERAPIIYL